MKERREKIREGRMCPQAKDEGKKWGLPGRIDASEARSVGRQEKAIALAKERIWVQKSELCGRSGSLSDENEELGLPTKNKEQERVPKWIWAAGNTVGIYIYIY